MLSRKRFESALAVLLALTTGLAMGAPVEGESYYDVTNLGTLNGSLCLGFSGRNSFATALNENGVAAGGSCAFAGFFQPVTHAFSWSEGTLTDLGTLGLGDDRSPDQSTAYGINDAGQIVGLNFFGFLGGNAVLWSAGSAQNLQGVLGDGFSTASDINNGGQIVGSRGTPPDFSSWSAFLYDLGTGEVTGLPGLGGTFRTSAVAINDAGQAAGYGTTAENAFHAVRWIDQVPTDLGTLGGTHSFATGINQVGDVIGRSFMPFDSEHAFLYREGAMQDLGTLGGSFSSAAGLNDLGQVVGSAGTETNEAHAFLYEEGVMGDLNERISPLSGWLLTEATAINGLGQIVGTGRINGETHAFLLSPSTPPPDTAPPIITVPGDMTIPATSGSGAVVFYVATVVDDVDHHPSLACAPPSGSLFPVGTTAVDCTATDNTGKSASASFNVTVLPPLDLGLQLSGRAPVDLRTGVVTIRGSVACNQSVFVFVSGQLTETVANRAVVQGSFFAAFTCTSPVTSWTATVTPDGGRFGAGHADASASVSGCSSSCDFDQVSHAVTVVGGHR